MRTIHDYFWITWGLEALLIKGIGCLLDVGVAVDLNLELVFGCVIAHVATFVHHYDAQLW